MIAEDYKLLTYLIFDAPSHGGKYEDRVKWLENNIPQDDDDCYAVVVGIKKCESADHLKKVLNDVTKAGGEGIMLRKVGSLYEHKRSSTLLKVKTFYDEEARVIGHKPGKGNFTGVLGALECELPNGKKFDVGTGFNLDQRRKPPKIGSVITFKFQELSNAGHPRFPVFLRGRTDLTWNDVLKASETKTPMSVIQKVIPKTKLSKQHSVLFSVIPSRDVQTGGKIITSDDEDEQPSSSVSESSEAKKSTDEQKICKFGAKCYRTNPDHFKQFQHPKKKQQDDPEKAKQTSAKPICIFGSKCYRKSSVHQANFSHPEKNLDDEQDQPMDTEELIEPEEPQSPSSIDQILVKDKNKGLTFDDPDDDEDQEEMLTKPKREWAKLESKVQQQSQRLEYLEQQIKKLKRATESDESSQKRLKPNEE